MYATSKALITSRTRAIVVINPNNPTGAVYSRATLTAIAQLAEKHHLVVFSDEIYDQLLYGDAEFVPMATLGERYAVRNARRLVEGLSRLRLSRRLGRCSRARSTTRAII
jgi:aspartate/methionine/tyrosine aminotransferase